METPETLNPAPTNRFLATPTPPDTIRAPVVVELESVVFAWVVTPVLLNWVANNVCPVTVVIPAKVETPETFRVWDVKFVADVTPNVEIPETLSAVPTRLLDKVIVAIPAAPVVPVTPKPVAKVNWVILPDVPTILLLESLMTNPVTAPAEAEGTQDKPEPVELKIEPAVPTLLLES